MVEEVPCLAGFVDDVVIAVEDGVGELVLAQVLPDVFGTVEFGRVARQADQGDIGRDMQAFAAVIACTVEKDCGMSGGIDRLADGFEMQVHHAGIGFGHDDGGGNGPAGTSGAEQIGPVVALIARRTRAGSAPGPDARQGALLADPCFILEPDFNGLAAGRCRERLCQCFGEVFLKASSACGSASGCCGRTDRRR